MLVDGNPSNRFKVENGFQEGLFFVLGIFEALFVDKKGIFNVANMINSNNRIDNAMDFLSPNVWILLDNSLVLWLLRFFDFFLLLNLHHL